MLAVCACSGLTQRYRFICVSQEQETAPHETVMLMADGPSFVYDKLVRETWHKKLVYKSHTEPSKFLIRETWQMTETTKNFKF